jgi:DNA topoisomerase-3
MSEKEKNIYELISKFYLIQFMPPAIYDVKTARVKVCDEVFETKAKEIKFKGYLSFFHDEKGAENNLNALLDFSDGNFAGKILDGKIEEKETSPPKRFTPASLITAMSSIANEIKDEELKKVLKEKDKDKAGESGSIGTSATRASIIDKLIKKEYIKKDGNHLISTDYGKKFYEALPHEIKTAEVTASWWLVQRDIIDGVKGEKDLINSVLEVIKKVISKKDYPPIPYPNGKGSQEVIAKCPLCSGDVIEIKNKKDGKESFICKNKFDRTCVFQIYKGEHNAFFSPKKISVNKSFIKTLCEKGKVFIKGIPKKDREGTYDAFFKMKEVKPDDKFINFELEFKNNFKSAK